MEIEFKILCNYISSKDLLIKALDDFKKKYNNLSQNDKILCLFSFNENLTSEEVKEYFPNIISGVILNRLTENNLIETKIKQSKFNLYNLTETGKLLIDRIINKILEDNYDYKNHIIEKRKEKINKLESKATAKIIINVLLESNIRPKDNNEIIIDLKKLMEVNYEAVELICSDFNISIELIKEYFREDIKDITNDNIIFINVPECEYQDIQNIDREYKGLIYTRGLLTSKKESIISKILYFNYFCINPDCEYSQDSLKTTYEIKKCPKCKSPIELKNQERINQLESKITNIESGISFPLYLQRNNASKFSYLGLGDEIEIIGYLEDKLIEDKLKKTKEVIKVLVVSSFKKIDLSRKLNKEEELEVENKIEKIKDCFREYMLTPFNNYIEQDFIKELFILQQLTRHKLSSQEHCIHIAWMGEPGVGKNQLIKIGEEYFPNNISVTGADITDAGFKGTVNRDTGIKEIGLAKQTQGGTIWLNEFDKFIKTNSNGKKAGSQLLNSTMTEQEINLNKAGIKITYKNLDLRHNLVFNPLDESKVKDNIQFDKMAEILDKSLLSRTIPLYVGRDKTRSKKVFSQTMLRTNKPKYDLNKELYKNILLYLRNKEIELTKKAEDKLEEIYAELLEKDENSSISVERIGLILIQLTKAVTKFNLKNKVGVNEVKEAYNYYMKALNSVGIDLDNLEKLFMDETLEELRLKRDFKNIIFEYLEKNKKIEITEIEKIFDKLSKSKIFELINKLKEEKIIYESPKDNYRWLN